MNVPPTGCASRLGMNTMQCITHGIFAMYLLTQRVAILPDMLSQVRVSFVCWTCMHHMPGLHCFDLMFVLPVSD